MYFCSLIYAISSRFSIHTSPKASRVHIKVWEGLDSGASLYIPLSQGMGTHWYRSTQAMVEPTSGVGYLSWSIPFVTLLIFIVLAGCCFAPHFVTIGASSLNLLTRQLVFILSRLFFFSSL